MAEHDARRERWLPPVSGRGRIGGWLVWALWALIVAVIAWFQLAVPAIPMQYQLYLYHNRRSMLPKVELLARAGTSRTYGDFVGGLDR